MGAWGTGIFDDDTALDTLDELQEANVLEFIETAFSEAKESEYLDYDQCISVLVSGAIIDYILNSTKFFEEDDEYTEWFESLEDLEVVHLKGDAVKALELVISDRSELNELWSENEQDYSKWKDNITSMIKRIK